MEIQDHPLCRTTPRMKPGPEPIVPEDILEWSIRSPHRPAQEARARKRGRVSGGHFGYGRIVATERKVMEIPQAARRLIESGRLAHLVTLNPDGSPHVSLAWAGIAGEEVVIGTIPDQRKLRNVRRDPRVAVSFETPKINEWGLNEYLVIHGQARVTEGGAPELLQRLAHIYLGPEVKFPPMPDPAPGFVTRIRAERISGIGPWVQSRWG